MYAVATAASGGYGMPGASMTLTNFVHSCTNSINYFMISFRHWAGDIGERESHEKHGSASTSRYCCTRSFATVQSLEYGLVRDSL